MWALQDREEGASRFGVGLAGLGSLVGYTVGGWEAKNIPVKISPGDENSIAPGLEQAAQGVLWMHAGIQDIRFTFYQYKLVHLVG